MILLLIIAMIEDLRYRHVRHSITLAMLAITLLHLIFNVHYHWPLIIGLFSVCIMGFMLWYFGIWGGSDSKWLMLSLPWLHLSAWSDWCFVFAAILITYLVITRLKPTQSLALLIPMNSASIILILFYRSSIWSAL